MNFASEPHYLFTVAACGHNKFVKPERMGVRHGNKVIDNRQLCVANAFEQIIEEKNPKIHKSMRQIYDNYGYPIGVPSAYGEFVSIRHINSL